MNKVAVVIVCTNQKEFLKDTFESLYNQTYQNFDILFLDNNSTDESIIEARELEKGKAFIYNISLITNGVVNKPLPIGITRWIIAQEAIQKGYEYIALLDADDMWHKDKLEKQMKVFEEKPNVKMIFSDCFYYNNDKQDIENKTFFQKHKPYKKDYFWKLLSKRNFMPCCTLIFEAKALKEVIGKPEAYISAEDFDWVLKMANKFDVERIDEPLAYYRIHPNQVSNNKARCLMEEIDVIKKACKLRELTQRQGERVYIHLLWLYIKLLLRELEEAENYIRELE